MLKAASLCWTVVLSVSLGWAQAAFAHAMPERSTPNTGATLSQAPATATIQFDSELEPLFSKLIVKDDAGKQVSKGNGKVDPSNPALLKTVLSGLPPGRYHVYWSVVSRDGHRTEGDYSFTVK
jgi:hypothetical protein